VGEAASEASLVQSSSSLLVFPRAAEASRRWGLPLRPCLPGLRLVGAQPWSSIMESFLDKMERLPFLPDTGPLSSARADGYGELKTRLCCVHLSQGCNSNTR